MENTQSLQFKDDKEEWYIAQNGESVGPFKAQTIFERLEQKTLSWMDLVWSEKLGDWKRLCDVDAFRREVPKPPAPPARKPPAPPQAPSEPKIWFLYYNDTQYGPFGESEVVNYLKIGKIHGKVFAWKEGQDKWERLDALAPFEKEIKKPAAQAAPPEKPFLQPDAKKEKTKGGDKGKTPEPVKVQVGMGASSVKESDRRVAPRAPLIARVLLTDENTVVTGMCRDLSVGGMQVLADRVPGEVGAILKMNIVPTQDPDIKPFATEAVIVRVFEDRRGFSVVFQNLEDSARKSIEKFLEKFLDENR
jgi:hypothetical protein